ncbi:MAG: nucleotidyltransferase domain-containing protein, partial [Desulfobacteria bacterium]
MSARSGKNVAPVGFPPVTRGQLRRVGEKIAGLPGVEKVILFGSYARGNPTPDSDVDLLVVW